MYSGPGQSGVSAAIDVAKVNLRITKGQRRYDGYIYLSIRPVSRQVEILQ